MAGPWERASSGAAARGISAAPSSATAAPSASIPTGLDAAAHPLKLWDGDQALQGPQALLVGEAACLVDPFTAEGIRPAILSGYLAAEAVHAALAGQDRALEGYTQAIQAPWGTEMAWARRLAQVFYRLPAAAYRLGVARPGAAQRMGQILSGEVRYSEVAQHALAWLSQGGGPEIPGPWSVRATTLPSGQGPCWGRCRAPRPLPRVVSYAS